MHHGYTPVDAIFASMPDRNRWLEEQHARHLSLSEPAAPRSRGRLARILSRAAASLAATVGGARRGVTRRTAAEGI